MKSRDDSQLLGKLKQTVSDDCAPFIYNEGKPIAPCGAIANSLFSDILNLTSLSLGKVPLLRKGIAWPSDKEVKFNNPPLAPKQTLKDGEFIMFFKILFIINMFYFLPHTC